MNAVVSFPLSALRLETHDPSQPRGRYLNDKAQTPFTDCSLKFSSRQVDATMITLNLLSTKPRNLQLGKGF